VSAGVSLPAARYPGLEERRRFWQQAEQQAAQIPGVRGVGLATEIPPDQTGNNDNFNLVEYPVPAGAGEPTSPWYYVSLDYFRTLGVPLLAGRLFTAADTAEDEPTVVVSRSWARRYVPGGDAVGKRLVQGGCYDCPRTTIVGVVADIRNVGPSGAPYAVYSFAPGNDLRDMHVVVRSNAGPAAALRSLRERLHALDPELPLEEAVMADRFDDTLSDPRKWAALLSAFGVVGMALAALGVFGLMSYAVRQRRREIGVRLALGAQPGSVTALVVSRGMRYAIVGSGIGLVLTLATVSRIRALLYETSPTDPGTLAGVAVLLLLSAYLASWIPARRAARIRPSEAMGSE
jgi:predicted permease